MASPTIEPRILGGILLLAAVLRIAFVVLFPDQSANLPDAAAYRAAAHDILTGRIIEITNVMPGYPLLIAATGGLGSLQLLADIGISVATVWLLTRIVWEITTNALAALIAGLIWAIYPFSAFYAVVGLTETLFVFLLLLSFFFYYRASFGLGSLALVLAIMVRPFVEIFAPVALIVFAVVVHRLDLRRTVKNLGGLVMIYLLLMAPWWAHNFAKYGSFVRLNAGAGIVLYSGNNSMNRSGGGIGGVDLDTNAFGDISDPLARDRALRQAAVEFIRENPGRFIELAGLKFLRLWRLWPYAEAYVSPLVIIASVASFVPVLVLGIAGLGWGARRYGRAYVPIVLFICFTTAIHMITIASIRYRFPMEPFLVVLAAPFIASVLRRLAGLGETQQAAVRVL